MKKILLIFLTIFLSYVLAFSQNHKDSVSFNKNAIYFELLGSAGLIYNITYDRILFKSKNLRLSSSFGVQPFILSSITPQFNIIYGNTNFFEMGIGFLYYFKNFNEIKQFAGFPLRFGYRYQKNNGKLFFKIAYTPIILVLDNNFSLWGGLAIGRSF